MLSVLSAWSEQHLPALLISGAAMGVALICAAVTGALRARRHRSRAANLEADLAAARVKIENLQETTLQLRVDLARKDEALVQSSRQQDDRERLLRESYGDIGNSLRHFADEVLRHQAAQLKDANKAELEPLLQPLRERLKGFEDSLGVMHRESLRQRSALAQQIEDLSHASSSMLDRADNLARALKGDPQRQGAWGEMVLDRILQSSGLIEGQNYVRQLTTSDVDGARVRPDVVVMLPGDGKLVVDSKVSLTAYERWVNATAEPERADAIRAHVASLKTHIRTLGDKRYFQAVGGAIDYVVMFLPVEGALAAALDEDPDLTAHAIARHVCLATPTTLLIALRTAASVWRVEAGHRHAEEIAGLAGQLYDRFCDLVQEIEAMGKHLSSTQRDFERVMQTVKGHKGGLMHQAERLRGMGAITSKRLAG